MEHNPKQTLRVALYARVSTDEQREGQTIDSQVAELEHFAKEKGWLIAGVYKDEGWSGSILARPELDHLRDDASKSLFEVVLINDVDRLARDVSHLGIVKRDLERRGIQVIFKKLPAEKSPTHNLMVNILGSFAEFERELIADRTRRGRRHKVEVRQQYLGSYAPYGYRYIPKDKSSGKDGYLEVVPEEAVIVRQMYEWVDKEGLSARKVVKRLNAMRVPPKKGATQWAKSSVLRILRNETYSGVWHYNKHESCEPTNSAKASKYKRSLKSSVRLRAKAEWLSVILPEALRMIERDQWNRVQSQLTQNIAFSPRNAKHEYLLKGLVRCGGCSARYVGESSHDRFYYRCLARCKTCPMITEHYLDDTVWGAIEEAILNPSLIADQITRIREHRASDTEKLNSEAKEIQEAIEQVGIEEERILKAYRKGILSAGQLGGQLKEIKARKEALQSRMGSVSKDAYVTGLPEVRRSLLDYCTIVALRLKSFGAEERQRFLRMLIDNIVFEGEQVRIMAIIKTSVEGNRIATTGIASNGRNSALEDGIEGTGINRYGRNEVIEVPFELVRPIVRIKRNTKLTA